MIPYLIVLFFVISLGLLDVFKIKNRQFLLPVLFAILFLFLSWRDGIGADYYSYKRFWEKKDIANIETGYLLIQNICKRVYDSYPFTIAIFGLIAIYIKFLAFKKLSPLIFVSIIYYFGYYYLALDFNQIRQGLALGICLLSVNYVIEESKTKFLSTILLASLFHISALVSIPIYFLYHRIKYTSSSLTLILLLSFCLLFIDTKPLILDLMSLVYTVSPFDFIKARMFFYQYYTKEGFYLGSLFLLYFSYLFIYYKDIVNDRRYTGILNCFLFGVFLNFFFNSIFGLIRLSYYYIILGSVLYAYIIIVERKIIFKVVWFIILALIMSLKYINYITSSSQSYIPYKTYLF